jgi:hypothetical protein
MPGPLTYVAVALLARDRLGQVKQALAAKKAAGTAKEIELQVLYLAEKAHAMLSAAQPTVPAPLRLYGAPLSDQVSRLALLGAMGPDLPRYAAWRAPGQEWLFDTLHKGNPDLHRERVLARSTDLVFETWRRAALAIDREHAADADRRGPRSAVQAYLLGHLCHVAADVVSHPWFEEVESHLGVPGRGRLTRDAVAGALDRHVAAAYFARSDGRTHGRDWGPWWAVPGDLPDAFYTAYDGALRELYGDDGRPEGWKAFEDAFRAHDPPPPALSPRLLRDGFGTFRTVAETGHGWDMLDWMGVTAPTVLVAFAAYPLASVLTRAGDFTTPLVGTPGEIAEQEWVRTYELLTFPLAVTALTPLVTMVWVSAGSFGVGREIVTGWVAAGVQVLAAVGFFATLGGAGEARWALFLVVPLIVETLHAIHVIAHGGRDNRHRQLAMGTTLHATLALVFLLCYRGFLHFGTTEMRKPEAERDEGTFIGLMALWLFLVVAFWVLLALYLRLENGGAEADPEASVFVTGRKHYVRLYDDTGLVGLPPGPSPTLAELHYPPDRRPLLKLWWEEEGTTLHLRSDRDRLVFSLSAAGAAPQTVFVPAAPTTLAEFAAMLGRTVKDSTGATGKLRVELAALDDTDYALPAGEVFADHGDEEDLLAEHDAKAGRFLPVGKSAAEATLLYHAPRRHRTVRFGRTGPVLDEGPRAVAASPAAGRLTSDPVDGRIVRGVAGTDRFTLLFRPGDVVQTTPAPGQQRIVVEVRSDAEMLVATPFAPALAGAAYQRGAIDRTVDAPAPAAWTVTTGPRLVDLTGAAGSVFGSMFRPGDTVRITPPPAPPPPAAVPPAAPHERRVVAVTDTVLTLDDAPDLILAAAPGTVTRVADPPVEGFTYAADPSDNLFAGERVMNEAADLAALLCLGGASRLLRDAEREPGPVGTRHGLGKVYQVFRNWNLDRRRENEWRMLVAGGAVSEKRGDPEGRDAAAPVEAGWEHGSLAGEGRANEMGWVPLFRAWIDMARRPGTNATEDITFRPGMPTNLELSRAMAFLLDMRDPAAP